MVGLTVSKVLTRQVHDSCLSKRETQDLRVEACNLRIETGRHEGPRSDRFCCRCKRLLGESFVAPTDYKEHLLFSCEGTKDVRLRFAGLPMSLQEL
jgi:hypothetical protein